MIVTFAGLPALRERHRAATIALVGGVFDLLHPGHISLFRYAKQAADIVVVAVSSDARVKQRKGIQRPIHDENIRVQVVDAIRYADYSLIAPQPDGREPPTAQVMARLRPDLFLSPDQSWQPISTELGIELRVVPMFDGGTTTTRTIRKVVQVFSCADGA
ncbi:adenylyltransferase/cytidyltransferase family protein [Nocardia sp. NPDC051570]|uniref:adenylyltransferase/cytidyltransferase family protein n=1 Tax=Nocardia sp. NPDC051570 TaxID=3364324 RepID=UPI003798B155